MWSVSSTLQLIVVGVSHYPWDNHHITHNSFTKSTRFLHITYSLSNDNSPSTSNHNHLGFDPSPELFGLDVDMPPRDAKSDEPKSWFGPNGQYIRELPCPSCRGRGYTPCSECGIERSRQDCSLCNGKGIMTCQHCLGECVIWEESIDENPWEKARSISPLKVKEDDEVDKLELNLDARKKPKRIYRSTPPEVGLKISRSLKSLNAKTGLFSKRMKIIHRDPELHAQRVAAIKKAKGTAAARKHTSETLKIFFSDPENRRKRSISMKGVRFFCKNCGIEGHRSNYCPDRQENTDRSFKCGLCGEKGHNKRTCGKPRIIQVKKRILGKYHCRACGKVGHNRRTCSLKTELLSHRHSNAHVRRGYLEDLKVHVPKHHHHCSICGKVGHNRSTCSLKTVLESDSTSTTPENRRYVENSNEDSHDASKRDDGGSLEDPVVEYRGSLGDSKGVDKSFLEDSNKISHKHYYHCSLCGGVGHSRRTCPLKMELESDITASGATGSLEEPKQDYGGSLGKGVYTESNVITIKHHCSLCGKVGHNRRTCSLSESGSLGHKGSLKNSKEFLQNHYHHCSICRKSGHNRRTCSESPSEDIEVTSRSYHCRICGVSGHNRRSCVKLSIRED